MRGGLMRELVASVTVGVGVVVIPEKLLFTIQ